jgi:hypothetical protein
MSATTCGYCWSGLPIFHGLFHLVFDRGKIFYRFLNVWYVVWMVKQGNSDFSSCNWRIFGRHYVRKFLIESKSKTVEEATWRMEINVRSQSPNPILEVI